MRNAIGYFIALLIGVVLGLWFKKPPRERQVTGSTSVVVQSDTTARHDTVFVRLPALADVRPIFEKRVTLAMAVDTSDRKPDSVAERSDSVDVMIPIEQRHYAGENYNAWVSGYDVKLDSINVISQERTITVTKTVTKRWGLSGGLGVSLTRQGIEPAVFIGATYTFYAF